MSQSEAVTAAIDARLAALRQYVVADAAEAEARRIWTEALERKGAACRAVSAAKRALDEALEGELLHVKQGSSE